MTAIPGLPESCAVAFKEWAGVCRALIEGDQALILRKGGIAEGPGGFVPEHRVFWLYPTRVHQGEQGLRVPSSAAGSPAESGTVEIEGLVQVESIDLVEREETLGRLEALHVWTEETVRKRFHYRRPGLWVLGVRVFRRPRGPFKLDETPEHSGCKTWVSLDLPVATVGVVPVLDDERAARHAGQLREALSLGR